MNLSDLADKWDRYADEVDEKARRIADVIPDGASNLTQYVGLAAPTRNPIASA